MYALLMLPALILMVAITVPVIQGMKEMVSIVQVSTLTNIVVRHYCTEHVFLSHNICTKKYKSPSSIFVGWCVMHFLNKWKCWILCNACKSMHNADQNAQFMCLNITLFITQILMNVEVSSQCVTAMLIVLILMVAMSVHAGQDTLAMEHTALVIILSRKRTLVDKP